MAVRRRWLGVAALVAAIVLASPAAAHYIGIIYYPPATDGDGLYVSGTDGGLYGLALSGEPEWSRDLGTELTTRARVADGTVHVGTLDGRVVAVGTDGEHRWTANLTGRPNRVQGLRIADGRVYATTELAVAAVEGGEVRWSRTFERLVLAAPAVGPDGVYVGTTNLTAEESRLYALDREGEVRWSRPYSGIVGTVSTGPNGRIYAEVDGTLHVLRADGTVVRSVFVGSTTAPPAFLNGTAIVGNYDGKVVAIEDGEVQWSVGVGDSAAPTVGPDGRIYATTGDSAVAIEGGEVRWNRTVGATLLAPPTVADRIYLGTSVNRTYALERNGSIAWIDRYETPYANLVDRTDLDRPSVLASARGEPTRVVPAPADRSGDGSSLAVVVGVVAAVVVLSVVALVIQRFGGRQ